MYLAGGCNICATKFMRTLWNFYPFLDALLLYGVSSLLVLKFAKIALGILPIYYLLGYYYYLNYTIFYLDYYSLHLDNVNIVFSLNESQARLKYSWFL